MDETVTWAASSGVPEPSRGGGAPPPSFLNGELLLSRFRVVRFLGQGGMGQVFEAFDERLRSTIAIKVVRPDFGHRRGMTRRLREEVEMARRVTHANVCRVYDLFADGPERTDWGNAESELLLVTMQLLRGPTLAQRIRDEGVLRPPAVLRIAGQIAEGLDAAHAVGVEHRDLKSSNVILETDVDGERRAVITDFGLARLSGAEVPGPFRGTPSYAAPELLSGGSGDARSDVYSFGVVVHEMLVGSPPGFEGARPPHAFRQTLRRCLDPDPHRRFDSAGAAMAHLERRRRRPWEWLSFVVVAAMLLGLWSLWRSRPQVPEEVDLAVVDLHSATSGDAWVTTAVRSALATQLDADRDLRVLPSRLVRETMEALGLAATQLVTDRPARRSLRRALGVEALITAEPVLDRFGGQARLRLQLTVGLEDGEIVPLEVIGSPSEIAGLARLATDALREPLGLAPRREPSPTLTVQLPQTAEGLRLYSEAMVRLEAGALVAAVSLLAEVIELEGASPSVLSALAEAAALQGDDRTAREYAVRALQLVEGDPGQWSERLVARSLELAGRWDAADQRYADLMDDHDDSLHDTLGRARVLSETGKAQQALRLLQQLRADRAEAEGLALVHLQEAEIAERAGLSERQLAAAGRAFELAEAVASKALLARASLLESGALHRRGEVEAARQKAAAALIVFEQLEDRWSAARAALFLGVHRVTVDSLMPLPEALEVFRGVGDRAGEARTLALMSTLAARSSNEIALAEEQARSAVDLAGQLAEARSMAEAHAALGLTLWVKGEEAASLQAYRLALAAAQQGGHLRLQAGYRMNLALVERHLGDVEGVMGHLTEAAEIFRSIESHSDLARVLNNLAQEYRRADRFLEAEAAAQEAVDLLTGLEEPEQLRTSLVRLAWIHYDQRELEAARAAVFRSIETARSMGRRYGHDLLMLARIQWRAGEPRAALDALGQLLNETPPGLTHGDGFFPAIRLDMARIREELEEYEQAAEVLVPAVPTLIRDGSAVSRRSTARLLARLQLRVPSFDAVTLLSQLAEEEQRGRRVDHDGIVSMELARLLNGLGREEEACTRLQATERRLAESAPDSVLQPVRAALRECQI